MDNTAAQPPPPPGGKKKRAYATQGYEFGQNATGLNAPLQPDPSASLAMQSGGQGYGQTPAYGQQAPVPAYGQQPPVPAYGQPAVGGLQNPVGGQAQEPLAQQFGQMNLQSQPQQPQAHGQPVQNINQLYPSDLISQPFVVQELENPPPPIILPPNVSYQCADMHD